MAETTVAVDGSPTDDAGRSHRRLTLPQLAACALVILLSAWIQMRVVRDTVVYGPVRADATSYVSYAWNLRTYHVFSRARTWLDAVPAASASAPAPDKLTLPGYPAFLSVLLEGKPDPAFMARATFLQGIFGVLACAFVLATALRLVPFGWAIATGVVMAISPHLASISTYLLTESLYTLLVAASLFAVVMVAQRPRTLRWPLLAGVVLAVACYVRPQLQPVPFVLAGLCLLRPALAPYRRGAVLAFACFALLLAPWTIRNAGVPRPAGEPDLLPQSVYHGSFPDFRYHDDPKTAGYAYEYDPDAAVHSHDLGASVRWIGEEAKRDPAGMARWYLWGKTKAFLSWDMVEGQGDVFVYPVTRSPYLQSPAFAALHAIAFGLHWPLMLLALAAMVIALALPQWLGDSDERRCAVQALALTFAVVLFLHVLGAPYPRYSIPFRPLAYLLAMIALSTAWQQWRRTKAQSIPSRLQGAP